MSTKRPRAVGIGARSAANLPTEPLEMTMTDQPTTETVCLCGHPMRQHHEDVCLTECGCQDGSEPEAPADLPDRLEAALTARFTELGNPFSRMRIAFQGPDGWPASKEVGPHDVALVLRELLATAPAVPPPADRAAVLREAAERLRALAEHAQHGVWVGMRAAADELRRLAAEAQQQDEIRCSCGGRFPLHHLHADDHQPAADGSSEEPRP